MANSVHITHDPSGVAVITLDSPGKKFNLLSQAFMDELNEALRQTNEDPKVKGRVIISGKANDFVTGADLNEIRAFQNRTSMEAAEKADAGKCVFKKIAEAKFPTVVAINGLCLGGGTEIALAAQIRIATKERKTKIGLPEVKLGFLPAWGGCSRMPHIVGIQKAIELVTTGNEVDSQKAWRIGLVDELVEKDKLCERAIQLALGATPKRSRKVLKQMASDFLLEGNPIGRAVLKSQSTKLVKAKSKGYLAPNEIVKIIWASVEKGQTEEVFKLESDTAGWLVGSSVSKNLVNIFFAQQRSKEMPDNFKPAIDIKTVGVLGAGVMGAGIAQAALYAGYIVVLKEVPAKDGAPTAFLDKGVAFIKGLFDGLVDRGKLTRKEADEMMSRLKPTLEYKDMSDCDMVIEAVPETMFLKRLCRNELEKVIEKPFIYASNTSGLLVGEMAKAHPGTTDKPGLPAARHPDKVVGLHFFNPVHKMPLVEVIKTTDTSDEVVGVTKAFAMKLGKTAVATADSPLFIVNRVLMPYMIETGHLVGAGVPPADIDKAMRTFGMPMGPLELMDEVGLDICEHVVNSGHTAFGARMSPPSLLFEVRKLGLLGKKGGKGIYLFDAPGGKVVKDKKTKKPLFNPDVINSITAPKSPKHMTEIQDRLMLVMVNEAARCIEENVVSEPSQLDLAMIFGTGFPPFRGGVLRYADAEGIKVIVQKLEWLSTVSGENYKPCNLLKKMAETGETFYK